MKRLLVLCGLLCALSGFGGSAPAQAAGLNVSSEYSAVAVTSGSPVTINALVTVVAPEPPRREQRPPVAVSLVIDHSGSMQSARKLDYAIQAGKTLVRNLEKDDEFSLVIYDDTVKVVYPMGRVTDKDRIYRLLDSIQPDGYTFLSGGLEAGIAQFNGTSFNGVRRVILLSDGLANRGVTNGEQVAGIGARSRHQGVNVSAIGLGLDYDEDLMQLLAQRGGGNYYYIKDSEDLPSVFRQELALAGQVYTRELNARLSVSPLVSRLRVHGYSVQDDKGVSAIEMSDFVSAETRQILLTVTFQPDSSAMVQDLGTIRFSYADAQGNRQTVEAPLTVTLAESQAAAEAMNAHAQPSIWKVRDEALLIQADEAQVEAMQALQAGRTEEARRILQQNRQILIAAAPKNTLMAAKAEQLAEAEQGLDAAASDRQLQRKMLKGSKNVAYMSAKGQKTGILLKAGDQGLQVEKLQKALADRGFYSGPVHGVFDAAVTEAVKKFQQANNLDADGLAGPATMSALGI